MILSFVLFNKNKRKKEPIQMIRASRSRSYSKKYISSNSLEYLHIFMTHLPPPKRL